LAAFFAGIKPATYIILKVGTKNLSDKYTFESLLDEQGIVYSKSRPKGYEEIRSVSGNVVKWALAGVWIGYDLFNTIREQKMFKKYVSFIRRGMSKKGDLIAGKIYGYPSCCVKNFIKEDAEFLAKNYTYFDYFKKLHDMNKAFGYVAHTPCSVRCSKTAALDKSYERAVRSNLPKFYSWYNSKKKHSTELIIDLELDIKRPGLAGQTIWPVRDGHDYRLVSRAPFNGKYYITHLLTRDSYVRGAIISADLEMQRNHTEIKIKKVLPKVLDDFHHERKLVAYGRAY
ncbi:MAG: DUF483 domain-containing protein, partial [Candidatus Woesearchaeota archaeon]